MDGPDESPAGDDPEVSVSARDAGGTDLGWIRERLARALALVPRRVRRVHVELVADAEMDRLHRRHAGVPGTTDVLTFPASDPADPSAPVEVDIVACVDEAARRAAEFGHPPERELLLYALHGVLHCCGHDDHDPAAFARMHAEEDRLLALIGVGPTYRPAGRGPDREAAS